MAYINNNFCWHGVLSTDLERAKSFYGEVLGWKVQTAPMGDGEVSMFAAADIPRAHLAAPEAGVPSHFENYLRVEDVDATTRAAAENGGRVLAEATDIPPGRFSVVASPSGAALFLFHEANPNESESPPPGQGSFHWVELHSKDLDADLAWMKSTFGVTVDTMPMPDGPYYLIKDGEKMLGGAMPAMNPEAPAMWLPWIEVSDVDATFARVSLLGGQALTEVMAVEGVGRMAAVMDPSGAAFGIITPPAV